MAEELTRESKFAYTCNRCSLCCRAYSIRVNPYETARLARFLGISTGEFLAKHTQSEGIELRRDADFTCSFLGPEGCSVHPARPMVCRLYPLGRHLDANARETFSTLSPQPGSKGVYGEGGRTIAEFLAGQGAQPYLDAADAYNRLITELTDIGRDFRGIGASEADPQVVLDMDYALENSEEQPEVDDWNDIEARYQRHIKLLREKLSLHGRTDDGA